MLNGSVDDSITWFNRCTAAQIDYNNAYDIMTNALRPKWNGSADLLLEMGNSCYKSGVSMKRIVNGIPLKMLAFYRVAASEGKGFLWQIPYRRQNNKEKIKKCITYWLGNNKREQNKHQSARAIFSYYAGDYAGANEIIQHIGAKKNDTGQEVENFY